ncbi:MAG: hypothetical protein GQ569_09265 [Methylococcaceae bacterium]|nr:hypothetical protein [Methylococcaceae bacterium]
MNNMGYGNRSGSLVFGNAGIAEGTNAATAQIATAFDFTINGMFYTKAITDNIALTATAQQAAETTCLYALSIDAAGAVTTTKGVEVSTTELANGQAGLTYPTTCPDDEAVFGVIKVATAAATTFTTGTTDLGAAGITDTYYNVSALPADNLA